MFFVKKKKKQVHVPFVVSQRIYHFIKVEKAKEWKDVIFIAYWSSEFRI